jgi:hypothetical protein
VSRSGPRGFKALIKPLENKELHLFKAKAVILGPLHLFKAKAVILGPSSPTKFGEDAPFLIEKIWYFR